MLTDKALDSIPGWSSLAWSSSCWVLYVCTCVTNWWSHIPAFLINMSVLRFITTVLMLKSTLWALVTLQTALPSFSNFTKFPCHMACMINSPNADNIPQLIRNSKPNLKQKLWGSLRSISKVGIPLPVSSVCPDRRQLAWERREKR